MYGEEDFMSSESKRPPRKFSTEQVAILRPHLVDKVPISDLCDEYKLPPRLLYQWQRQLFENLAGAFERTGRSVETSWEKQLTEKGAPGSQAPRDPEEQHRLNPSNSVLLRFQPAVLVHGEPSTARERSIVKVRYPPIRHMHNYHSASNKQREIIIDLRNAFSKEEISVDRLASESKA
jgi:transposase